MKKIIRFVTGNKIKFEEVKLWINELNPTIELEQVNLDLPEIQSLSLREVALSKAISAWRLLKKPLLVDDEGLFIHAYNNFPGALTKHVYQGIGLNGLWTLAQNNPEASFSNCLVYCENEDSQLIFDGSTSGILIKPTNNISNTGNAITENFIPHGFSKSLAEIKNSKEGKEIHYRYKSLKDFTSQI